MADSTTNEPSWDELSDAYESGNYQPEDTNSSAENAWGNVSTPYEPGDIEKWVQEDQDKKTKGKVTYNATEGNNFFQNAAVGLGESMSSGARGAAQLGITDAESLLDTFAPTYGQRNLMSDPNYKNIVRAPTGTERKLSFADRLTGDYSTGPSDIPAPGTYTKEDRADAIRRASHPALENTYRNLQESTDTHRDLDTDVNSTAGGLAGSSIPSLLMNATLPGEFVPQVAGNALLGSLQAQGKEDSRLGGAIAAGAGAGVGWGAGRVLSTVAQPFKGFRDSTGRAQVDLLNKEGVYMDVADITGKHVSNAAKQGSADETSRTLTTAVARKVGLRDVNGNTPDSITPEMLVTAKGEAGEAIGKLSKVVPVNAYEQHFASKIAKIRSAISLPGMEDPSIVNAFLDGSKGPNGLPTGLIARLQAGTDPVTGFINPEVWASVRQDLLENAGSGSSKLRKLSGQLAGYMDEAYKMHADPVNPSIWTNLKAAKDRYNGLRALSESNVIDNTTNKVNIPRFYSALNADAQSQGNTELRALATAAKGVFGKTVKPPTAPATMFGALGRMAVGATAGAPLLGPIGSGLGAFAGLTAPYMQRAILHGKVPIWLAKNLAYNPAAGAVRDTLVKSGAALGTTAASNLFHGEYSSDTSGPGPTIRNAEQRARENVARTKAVPGTVKTIINNLKEPKKEEAKK